MSTVDNSLQAILDLYADYALCLDERNFSSWPDFFAGDCRYEVHSRENWDLGLPSAMVYCDSHGMVQDRVSVLENTLTFQYLHMRHLITNIRVSDSEGGAHKVTANYLVLHSTEEGETRIFSTGKYDAEVVVDGTAKFRKLIVIADTSAIDNLLAVPL